MGLDPVLVLSCKEEFEEFDSVTESVYFSLSCASSEGHSSILSMCLLSLNLLHELFMLLSVQHAQTFCPISIRLLNCRSSSIMIGLTAFKFSLLK